MNKRGILTNLQRYRKALPKDGWDAENLLIGCLQTLQQAGQRGFPAWLDRNERRGQFRRIKKSFQTRRGQKALRDLLDLTISAVEACNWVDDYWVGALPLEREPWQPTEARKAAQAKARAVAHRQNKAQKKAREEAYRARMEHERTIIREYAQGTITPTP